MNTTKYQARFYAEGELGWDDYGQLFDPDAVANLEHILKTVPDVKIVVESSWKVNGLDELSLMWVERGLPGTLYDVTPTIFCEELLTVDLSDPDSIRKVEGLAKGREIRAWLRRYVGPDCRYVILDDMADFDGNLRGHAIQTDSRVGVTESDDMVVVTFLKS